MAAPKNAPKTLRIKALWDTTYLDRDAVATVPDDAHTAGMISAGYWEVDRGDTDTGEARPGATEGSTSA